MPHHSTATAVQSNAKSAYLLSDSDLSKLGYVEKQNPRHQKFANMKQYLVSQVRLQLMWQSMQAAEGWGTLMSQQVFSQGADEGRTGQREERN